MCIMDERTDKKSKWNKIVNSYVFFCKYKSPRSKKDPKESELSMRGG